MLGVSLLSQGLAEMGQADASGPLAVVALSGGLFILAGTMFRRRLEARFQHFHAAVSLIEGVLCGLVGAASAQRGTSYIQYAWLVAAVAFIGAAVIKLRKTHRSMPRPPEPGVATTEQKGDGR